MAPRSPGMDAYRERALRAPKTLQAPAALDGAEQMGGVERTFSGAARPINGVDALRDALGAVMFLFFGAILVDSGLSSGAILIVALGCVFVANAVASALLTAFWQRYPKQFSISHLFARVPGAAVSLLKWLLFLSTVGLLFGLLWLVFFSWWD